MLKLVNHPVLYTQNGFVDIVSHQDKHTNARNNTMAYQVLNSHNSSGQQSKYLKLQFDILASPDDNYVSILQEFRAMGKESFALPWFFTNCHNAMSCTGGTINNDDHAFGLDCVKKYGGIYVPPYCAIIHQYMREAVVGTGQLVLASDSHTRYGCLGAIGIGEGGTEVARQAAGDKYQIKYPDVICVYLAGIPSLSVGPMDVALTLIKATFENGFSKNKILEFVGPGIANLDMDFRFCLDAMTTESGAFSTIWETDDIVRQWFSVHKRLYQFKKLEPRKDAYYDGLITINLSEIEPMIALPFHPSNVFSIKSLCSDTAYLRDVLMSVEKEAKLRSGLKLNLLDKIYDGRMTVQSATIGGCVGGVFENIKTAADILRDYVIPCDGVPLGIYPASHAVLTQLEAHGYINKLLNNGATIHPCICGPCFGTLDIPKNDSISARCVSRNYFGREGSRPDQGQLSASVLMDARSIAATILHGGKLTSAAEISYQPTKIKYDFDETYYNKIIFNGWKRPDKKLALHLGPNIKDWPVFPVMGEHLLLKVVARYHGSTTTDELCPSGEASSLRSNPEKLAKYTLITKDPEFVERAISYNHLFANGGVDSCISECAQEYSIRSSDISLGNLLISDTIGDGSSREQAVSNQKLLGIWANLTKEYSTKRYKTNCINWGVIPLQVDELPDIKIGEYLFLPYVRSNILSGREIIEAYLPEKNKIVKLNIGFLMQAECSILVDGCVINHYKNPK